MPNVLIFIYVFVNLLFVCLNGFHFHSFWCCNHYIVYVSVYSVDILTLCVH